MRKRLPLRLKPGEGFETGGLRVDIDDFIIVDTSLPAGLRAPEHLHERAYFTLLLSGGFEERFGATLLTTSAGTMNFVPAGAAHRTHSHGARLVRLELPERALALAADAGALPRQPTLFTRDATVAVAQRIAAELRARDHGWRLVVQGLLLELLGQAVRGGTRDSISSLVAPRWLREVKARLDEEGLASGEASLSLTGLARSAGVHPVHLARCFRAAYGLSIGAYVRHRQLRAAEACLRRSDARLCDIALSCGFADESHFSKAFRRAFGLPPGRYRRLLR